MLLALQVLCLIARWVEDPNSEAYKRHLARLPDNYWVAEDGLKIQVIMQKCIISTSINMWLKSMLMQSHMLKAFTHLGPFEILSSYLKRTKWCSIYVMQSFGCQMWDAGFAIQAILSCNLNEEFGPTLRKSHDFVKASQVRTYIC